MTGSWKSGPIRYFHSVFTRESPFKYPSTEKSNWLQTLVMKTSKISKIHILQISLFLPYETLFYDRTRTKTSQKRPCGWNPAFFGENHLNGGPPWTSARTRWRGWRKEEAEDLTKPEYWYMYNHVLPRLSAKASVHFVCPSLTEKTTSVGVSGECTDATERLERRARV